MHLVMAAPSARLGALLLRDAPVKGGDGGFFPSLFHVTDQARVVEFLGGGDGVARSLHAHLQDVRGNCLDVQLFHKRFEDVFGKTRHVIGVVEEDLDGAPSTQEGLETQWFGTSPQRLNRSGNSTNGASSSSSSGSSCNSSVFVPFHSTDQDDVLEIQVDITSDHLQIPTCTPSVFSTIGPVENGQGLLDFVEASHKAPFLRWVEEGGTESMRVAVQHTTIPMLTYRGTCIVRDGAHALAARCLVFSDLRCRFRHKARRQARRGTERRVVQRMSL